MFDAVDAGAGGGGQGGPKIPLGRVCTSKDVDGAEQRRGIFNSPVSAEWIVELIRVNFMDAL